MKNFKLTLISVAILALGIVGIVKADTLDATSSQAIIDNYTGNIGQTLSNSLPAILVVAAAVFGIILLVRLAKRFIGGR